jgi:hypothetical protein
MTMRQVLVACALITLSLPAHAAIEWDFTPTAFVACVEPCKLTGLPVASLILDGPDSTGNVSFDGFGTPPQSCPAITSTSRWRGEAHAAGEEHISSTEPTGLGCEFCAGGYGNAPIPWAILDYSLSWREVAGELDAVLITFNTEQDGVQRLGLTGGTLATDYFLGGCSDVCDVTGVWTSDAPSPVPEPGTLALLGRVLAAFGFGAPATGLVYSKCGSHQIDMVATGTERRA